MIPDPPPSNGLHVKQVGHCRDPNNMHCRCLDGSQTPEPDNIPRIYRLKSPRRLTLNFTVFKSP